MCTYVPLYRDHYLQIGGWLNETHLYLVWLNRTQNERIFTMYDISGGRSMENRPVRQVKESVEMGWIVTDNVCECVIIHCMYIQCTYSEYSVQCT